MIGERYGRLTVIEKGEMRNKHRYMVCKCDCGNIKHVSKVHLVNKAIKSCGCLRLGEGKETPLAEMPDIKLAREFHRLLNGLRYSTE